MVGLPVYYTGLKLVIECWRLLKDHANWKKVERPKFYKSQEKSQKIQMIRNHLTRHIRLSTWWFESERRSESFCGKGLVSSTNGSEQS